MGLMETFYPADAPDSLPAEGGQSFVPVSINRAMVEELERDRTALRHWPAQVAELYRKEVIRRLYREPHFLFLLGLAICLATSIVDIIVKPELTGEGAALRLLAVAPISIFGLIAAERKWTGILTFCIGAAPIAFISVIVHLSFMLPPDAGARYLNATILLMGLANVVLPYSIRGLVVFDIAALLVVGITIALNAPNGIEAHADSLAVVTMIACVTLPVAARMEHLRQKNFLLNLRAKIINRELMKSNRTLHVLSETDPLTGIANRRCFERQFHKAFREPSEAASEEDRIGVLLIDIDHFKAFNDTHGHQAGDYCLRLAAKAFRDAMEGHGGIAARYGGEEFIGAVRMNKRSEITDLAETVRQCISDLLTPANSPKGPMVTASIGVGIAYANSGLAREEMVGMADAALYACKESGRNRVEVIDQDDGFRLEHSQKH